MNKRKVGIILLMLLMAITVFSGCSDKEGKEDVGGAKSPEISKENEKKEKPIVTIEMYTGEKIIVELYPNIAPNTVDNFVSLINQGYYNGLNFHRVIPNFMIQGGDPNGNGSGGPGYGIEGEFEANGIKNDLKHTRGVISMARSQDPNSAGSQFFIMVADTESLDGEYAGFGKVTEGMEVVDKIVSTKTNANDKPWEPQTIKTVTVDLLGETYNEPKIIK